MHRHQSPRNACCQVLEPVDDVLASTLPYSAYPDWQTSVNQHDYNMSTANSTTQFSRAYRTAGLIRPSPSSHKCSTVAYALIVDDYERVDGVEAEWTWRAMLPDDITAANISCTAYDCVIRDTLPAVQGESFFRSPEASGSSLLVRQLRPILGLKWGVSISYSSHDNRTASISCLDANMTSVAGNFITLIYPLGPHERPPRTAWEDGQVKLTTFTGCEDTIELTPSAAHPFSTVQVTRVG